MHHAGEKQEHQCLFLEVTGRSEESVLPLHSSIVLFLLSYCECTSFRLFLVAGDGQPWSGHIPTGLGAVEIRREQMPSLVRSCRLPAVLDADGGFCRAGLAVVLRHILHQVCEDEPLRRDMQALFGFKKTCLKACAEVSQWTRLCELSIPSAVEEFLRSPGGPDSLVPAAILHLERKLGEPVKVHNDDKIRRQKLQLQQQEGEAGPQEASASGPLPSQGSDGLELRAALAKLSVDAVQTPTTRGPSDIRKVKTTKLPPLEHVFAEGLYFTLADLVLIPCVHYYLRALQKHGDSSPARLPLLHRWYLRVQEVPGVRRAAEACGIALLTPQAPVFPTQAELLQPGEEEQESRGAVQAAFVGGPRPTMTKLKEGGVEPIFSPHPCPSWSLDWDRLPAAVNPTEGKMSDVRALRKRQQLNNLVAMVTKLARPGDRVVDFCSGGGHVGIVLAHALPECQVILIENKEESLLRAKARCAELSLKNVSFIQANLDYFTGPFQIGPPLPRSYPRSVKSTFHIGGAACLRCGHRHGPGALLAGRRRLHHQPLLLWLRPEHLEVHLPPEQAVFGCAELQGAHDPLQVRGPNGWAVASRPTVNRQAVHGLVDLDRAWAAESLGYSVRVLTMEPASCSPKNNMLVGVPAGQRPLLKLGTASQDFSSSCIRDAILFYFLTPHQFCYGTVCHYTKKVEK